MVNALVLINIAATATLAAAFLRMVLLILLGRIEESTQVFRHWYPPLAVTSVGSLTVTVVWAVDLPTDSRMLMFAGTISVVAFAAPLYLLLVRSLKSCNGICVHSDAGTATEYPAPAAAKSTLAAAMAAAEDSGDWVLRRRRGSIELCYCEHVVVPREQWWRWPAPAYNREMSVIVYSGRFGRPGPVFLFEDNPGIARRYREITVEQAIRALQCPDQAWTPGRDSGSTAL